MKINALEKKYKTILTIGKGNHGEIFKSKENKTEKLVAIKKIDKSLNNITNEYDSEIKNLKSSNNIIVNIIEKIDTEKYLYIIMDLCLTNINEYFHIRGKSFEFEEIKEIIFQMGKILQLLNENNITHKIFELSNFLISFDTINKITIKLSEISLKQWNNENLKIKDFITPPEIIKNKKKFYNSDIWTLGTIFYYILFGEYPYKEKNEKKFFEEIKKKELKKTNCYEINDLIEKMLCFDINKRISWNDFFNHSFFQNNLNKKIETIVNSNKIIKEEKNILPNEIHLSEIIEVKTDNQISLGINIGASKTLYSLFLKENNDKYITKVLLMNNSSRIIPSIICYTKTHRLFGEYSFSSLKLNIDSSYNNLSRIFDYNYNLEIYKNESIYQLKHYKPSEKKKIEFHFFNYKGKENKISGNNVLADFIYLINDYFFKKEKIKYTSTSFSVPDFYTPSQRQKLKLICESIDMKDVNIFTESSAITMYYGYTKYKDIFINEENKIMKNKKNILFIDIGHSKASFILSTFKYNEFKIEYVFNDYNFGGRNFDYLIGKYCVKEFKQINKLDKIELNDKMYYRLIEEAIKDNRKKLTINTDIFIYIDSFYNELDMNINLTREKFEELIQEYINKFKEYLNKVLKIAEEKNIKIDCVEIAGEIMRTPIFQKIIEKNNLKIGKSLIIDECTSIGAALLGNYYKGNFPFKELKNFIFYNSHQLNYKIIYDSNNLFDNILIPINPVNNSEKIISFDKTLISKGDDVEVEIYYPNIDENSNKKYFLKYFIDLDLIYEDNNNNNNDETILKFKILPYNLFLNKGILYIGDKKVDEKFYEIKINNKNYKINDESKKEFRERLKRYFDLQNIADKKYQVFIDKKMNINQMLYDLKNSLKENNINENEVKIKEIEKELKKNNLNEEDLKNIQNKINQIKKDN